MIELLLSVACTKSMGADLGEGPTNHLQVNDDCPQCCIERVRSGAVMAIVASCFEVPPYQLDASTYDVH